ncbi:MULTISPECIES: type II secretion system protein GspM [Pseudomonas]|uniref:type II secretion system protein GspM n=1 Tax=Pseudomonas TaxID=286 RepID=UPI000B362642|nr:MULTISPECIES: type II secretion system protein GspM [Pseudomonas]PMY35934.1 hypothetical protein C1Y35_21790 [Pseudomonas sp. GW456-L14]PMY49523.1 hypothetical protein C1Y34_27970 [Pseudomonas sp. GW456-L12]PMY60315.1 hypothetical protein C1Y32_31565 [Pseudomonas sp. FW126-L8]PNA69221.1 hypothetical protein C1Y33_31470 [Pseudomonas sp. FW305-76]
MLAAWRRAKAACTTFDRNDRRALMVLGGVAVLGLIHLGVSTPILARLAAAEVRFEQAHQLNRGLTWSPSYAWASSSTLSADRLRQELSQDPALAGIELLNLSADGLGTQSQFSGPAGPLLNWLASLEAQGVHLTRLHLKAAADDKLQATVHWQ